MLPEIKLDTGSFEEIARDGRNQIAGIYPQWTDHNYHDPGITFIELFAFLKEAQQFHMDQVGDRHKKKFLKLLGLSPVSRRPARLKAVLDTKKEVVLPEGSRFQAGEMVFETERDEYIPGSSIIRLMARGIGRSSFSLDLSKGWKEKQMMIYPFGKKPSVGNEFLICMDAPLAGGMEISLGFTLYDEYEVKRNPVKKDSFFTPITKISLEYWGKGSYKKGKIIEDETWGMIQDGRILFVTEEGMEKTEEEGTEGYFIKLRLEEGEYDTAPALSSLSLNQISLVQRETKARWKKDGFAEICGYRTDVYIKNGDKFRLLKEGDKENGEVWMAGYLPEFYPLRILGQGNGFPDQRFPIPAEGVMAEKFQIMAESLTEPGVFELWEQQEDFDCCGPADKVFFVDEDNGEIVFGNGWKGMAPETQIRIVNCFCTRGSAGNIKAGKTIAREGQEDIFCTVLEDGQGGMERENIDQCQARAMEEIRKPGRCITEEDYERAVRETPGLRIQAAKVLEPSLEQEENVIQLAVRPYFDRGEGPLNKAYRKNILDHLEDKRLLGTRIRLCAPEYTEISVYVEISGKPGYLKIREQVQEEIRGFFKNLEGTFGPSISRGSLYGRLDSMEGILKIHMLSIEARGNRISRSRRGDVFLPPAGVLLLKEIQCVVVNR